MNMNVLGSGVPIVAIGIILVVVLAVLTFVRNYHKVSPSKMLIINGAKTKHIIQVPDPKDGTKLIDHPIETGFDVVSGGARLVLPFVQSAEIMDISLMSIPLKIDRALDKDGVKVRVEGVANVRIGNDRSSMAAAAISFGGKSRHDIEGILKETVLGGLRGVVGMMDIKALYRDREQFSQEVQKQVAQDFARMGVIVSSLPIQEVDDTEGFLAALGRKQVAEALRDAEIGEAEAKREGRVKKAEAERIAQEAEINSAESVAIRQRQLDLKKAEIRQEVDARQAEAEQAGPLAKAMSERKVRVAQVDAESAATEARIALADQETLRTEKELQFKVIKPAEAHQKAAVINAEGAKQTSILEAQGAKQTKIIQAEAAFEAAAKQAEATKTSANAEAEAARMKGSGDADALKARQLAEAEGQRAKLLAQAEGAKAQQLAEAEGTKARQLAEAEGKKANLLAEAEGIERKLTAEATGKRQLAEALAKLDQTGRMLQILEAAPKVAEALGEALAKALGPQGAANIFGQATAHLASVDSIKILDMGGSNGNGSSNGLMKYAELGPQLVFNILGQAKALGLSLPQVLEKLGVKSELLDEFLGSGHANGALTTTEVKN